MSLFDDLTALEVGAESEEDAACSMQRCINDGQAWKMQGSFGRGMMAAIEAGHCMLGPEAKFDYYGNIIPSRDQVQAGTKGSRDYVADRKGEQWARMLEACDAR